MDNLKPVHHKLRDKWRGYTFNFEGEGDRRPDHPFYENVLHPPMMINTFCQEDSENFNLIIVVDGDSVEFEATVDINGGDMFRVDYGSDYNDELFQDRQRAREQREQEKAMRRNKNFNFKCPKCGFQCQNRFRIKHYNVCPGVTVSEHNS